MDDKEKISMLKSMLSPDEITDEQATAYIQLAEGIVLETRYPFGYPDGEKVPKRYETVQLQIAVELYSKKGTEGETGHSENSISRSYENGSVSKSLLNRIVPVASVPEAGGDHA